MKIYEITETRKDDEELQDWQASASLCKSSTPDSAIGASALSSCKSQGYRRRAGKKKHTVGKKRIPVAGKKIKGAPYGGPLPDYSK